MRGPLINLESGETGLRVAPAAGGLVASLIVGGRERLVTQAPPDCPPRLAGFFWDMFLMAP